MAGRLVTTCLTSGNFQSLNFPPPLMVLYQGGKMESTVERAVEAQQGCYKNYIRLRSNRYFNLADPQPDQFTISDIAAALSNICRFGGHCKWFYSVAEHSIHCANQAELDKLPRSVVRACFMHDAAEAFCGDVTRPLKRLIIEKAGNVFTGIELAILGTIANKYDIDFSDPRVGKTDMEMLIAERRVMFTPDKVKWTGEDEVRKLELSFQCWPPMDAESEFMYMAKRLGIKDN